MTHRGPVSPRRSARRRSPQPVIPSTWVFVCLLAAAVLALIAIDLTVLGGARHPGGAPSASNGSAKSGLLAQASANVVKVSSYDYRQIDQDEQAAAAVTTGAFAQSYIQSMTSQVKPQAERLQQTVSCVVQRSGVSSISADGRQAVVVLYVQLSTENALTKGQPRLDIASIQATMIKRGAEWYISQLVSEAG